MTSPGGPEAWGVLPKVTSLAGGRMKTRPKWLDCLCRSTITWKCSQPRVIPLVYLPTVLKPFSFLWSIWGWLKFKLLQSLKNIPRMISNLGQCWIVLKSRHSSPWDPLPKGCPFQSPPALATNKDVSVRQLRFVIIGLIGNISTLHRSINKNP